MDQQSIPERLRDHLEPGERLLWLGSPDPKWFSWRAVAELVGPVLFISFFLLAAVGIALAVSGDLQELLDDVQAWSPMESWIWASMAVGLLFSLVVATALVVMLTSALGWEQRQKELSSITNRGFLLQRSERLFSRTVWPLHRSPLDAVNALQVVRHADGTGTITFLDEWVELDVDERVNLSFVRIPDVDLALAIAYAAAEEAGIPPPERPRGTA